MKKLIRVFSLWLYAKTSAWVVPHEFYYLVSMKGLIQAETLLENCRKNWPMDPEIVKADVLLRIKQNIKE